MYISVHYLNQTFFSVDVYQVIETEESTKTHNWVHYKKIHIFLASLYPFNHKASERTQFLLIDIFCTKSKTWLS